jgi:Homeodomain-like domain
LSFFVCDGTVITSVTGAALPLLLGLATGDGRAAGLTRGGVVLTVNADRDVVERQLKDGELACPSCGGVLARWGNGSARRVRLPGRLEGPDGHVVLVPRRSRCRGCGVTHVLLPAWCLARRADAGEVIGLALEAKAAGAGHRVIAERLGRPASTVRGWLRAFAARAEQVRSVFTTLAVSLVSDPPLPAPAGSAVADAVAAVAAAAAAAAAVPGVGTVARWELAAAVTCGLLLAPAWPGRVANASWLWAAAG